MAAPNTPEQYGQLTLSPEVEQTYGPPPSELRNYDKIDAGSEFDSAASVKYDRVPPPNNNDDEN